MKVTRGTTSIGTIKTVSTIASTNTETNSNTNTDTGHIETKEIWANLVVAIMVVWKWGIGSMINFLFREGKSTSNLRSNNKIRIKPIRTTSIRTMVRALMWAMTLKDSKPMPNYMIGVYRKLAWSRARFKPKVKEKTSFPTILNRQSSMKREWCKGLCIFKNKKNSFHYYW